MIEDIKTQLESMVASGEVPAEMIEIINAAIEDPSKMGDVVGTIEGMLGGHVAPEPPMDIEDYYREADGSLYELKWAIGEAHPLSRHEIGFFDLDRKTQFFVLFTEWQRRETEGMAQLLGGQVDAARDTFQECLARAEQIDVDELRARSYERLSRVEQQSGELKQEEVWRARERALRASIAKQ